MMSCDDVQPLTPSSGEVNPRRFLDGDNDAHEGGTWATPARTKGRNNDDEGVVSVVSDSLRSNTDVVIISDNEKLQASTHELDSVLLDVNPKRRRDDILMTSVESIEAARNVALHETGAERPVSRKLSLTKSPPAATVSPAIPEPAQTKTNSQCCIIA
eukprot:GGOE01047418.1.p2 GENE.GGOE01047418.1~~GGOE01047418.1.p2  ORF type:complete len:158 (-),score=2.16 GGOE01047418.1:782-1255(-)